MNISDLAPSSAQQHPVFEHDGYNGTSYRPPCTVDKPPVDKRQPPQHPDAPDTSTDDHIAMDTTSTARQHEGSPVWMAVHRPQQSQPVRFNASFLGKTSTDNWLLQGPGGDPWNEVGMVAVGGSSQERDTPRPSAGDDGWSSRATAGSSMSTTNGRG